MPDVLALDLLTLAGDTFGEPSDPRAGGHRRADAGWCDLHGDGVGFPINLKDTAYARSAGLRRRGPCRKCRPLAPLGVSRGSAARVTP